VARGAVGVEQRLERRTRITVAAKLTATGLSPGTQEVRFATAMTGGVSLAVWMGGVARELNLLEQASRDRACLADGAPLPTIESAPTANGSQPTSAEVGRALYLRLLDLLDVTTATDVLSGTSAGGINAALLGFTRSRGLDLGMLRGVWLRTGAFESLLRDPGQESPPSLLQGDEVLLKGLRAGISDLASTGSTFPPGTPTEPPITTVFITTTVLSGETSRFVDDFGTLVQDVEHRGLFRFQEQQLSDNQHQGALALAARCSASFPGAFEPAFVPVGASDDLHPDMAQFSNTTRSHFVADGGLLMNRPIKPLIDEVFDRPADRQVRRVLLYVVPSPGETPDPRKTPEEEKLEKPLTFGGALLKDLGAALGQSIGAELRAIRQHNDAVTGIADTRLRVAELGCQTKSSTLLLLRPEALSDYRERESRALAAPIVTALMRSLTTMPADRMPPTWSKALAPGGTAEVVCRTAIANAIKGPWAPEIPEVGDVVQIAAFGRAPFDGAKAAAIAMLRAGWTLAQTRADRVKLAAATELVHAALAPAPAPNLALLVDEALAGINQGAPTALATVATSIAFEVEQRRNQGDLVAGWRKLADTVTGIARRLRRLASEATLAGASAPEIAAAVHEITTYLDYLGSPDVRADSASTAAALLSPDVTCTSLFQLHVVTRSMLPTSVETEQRLELVQVSADTRSHLTPQRSFAKNKLTGLQLHHFGAFYKSSWRANDWMWGRLDGAGWLVHILLDPRRIQVIVPDAPAGETRSEWFLRNLRERFPSLDLPNTEVTADLAFLDNPTATVPSHLAELSMWVATAFQFRIAVEEVPVVATEVLLNPTTKDSSWAVDVLKITNSPQSVTGAARAVAAANATGNWSEAQKQALAFIEKLPQPTLTDPVQETLLIEKLRVCPVPDETLAGESGEPLFTRTVTKAIAVAAAATTEAPELPAVVKPALGTVRKMTLLAYRLAAATRGNARSLALGGAFFLVVGILLLATSQVILGLTGVAVLGAGVYLLLLVSWHNIRNFWQLVGFIATGLVVIAAVVLSFGSVREWLFGPPTAPKKAQGFVGETVLPWLRSPWYAAPLVLVLLVVVIAGIAAWIAWLRRELEKAKKAAAGATS
jgi:patatin-related protein